MATKKSNPVHQAVADHIAQHHSGDQWTWNPLNHPLSQLHSGVDDIGGFLKNFYNFGLPGSMKIGAKKSPAKSTASAAPTTAPGTTSGVQAPGALQLGWQQYIMPYLQQLQQQMGATTQGYNSQMNSMLSGPNQLAMSPNVRAALQATQPGMTAAMNLQNFASLMSPVAGAGMDQLAQILQNTQAAQQQATGAYEKQLLAGEGIGSLTGLPGVAGAPSSPAASAIGAGASSAAGSPGLAGQLTQQQALQNSIIANGMGGNNQQINPLQQQQQYAGG